MPLGANSFFGSVVNQMQRTVKAVGFTIERVLTAISDCGTMSVVVDVSEFPDCSAIFIGLMSYRNFSPVAEVAMCRVASHTEFSLSCMYVFHSAHSFLPLSSSHPCE